MNQQYVNPLLASLYPGMFPNTQQKQEVITVNGEDGANAYKLPPNSSALVLDENKPVVYLVKTDGAGYKTVLAYTITPIVKAVEPTMTDVMARLEALEKKYESDIAAVKTSDSNEQRFTNSRQSSERKSNRNVQQPYGDQPAV